MGIDAEREAFRAQVAAWRAADHKHTWKGHTVIYTTADRERINAEWREVERKMQRSVPVQREEQGQQESWMNKA